MKIAAVLTVPALLSLFPAPTAEAQIFRPAVPVATDLVLVEGEAADAETLRLLAGIGEIRADLKLGLLFLQEDLQRPEGSHFAHAREVVLPTIAEGLTAAGVADIAPLLQALEEAKSEEAVKAAYNEAEGALLRARSALNPSSDLVLQSVAAMTQAAADLIDGSGTTPVADYQRAWEILIVARGELDLLAKDPAAAKRAGEQALAMDDVILFMPDPNQPAPVAFDKALILDLIGKLQTVATEA